MNRTFTLQPQQQQQQLNSTSRCNDSVVVDNSITEESVVEREKQKKSTNKKILIVDDEPDITFTFRTVLEVSGFKEIDVYNEPLLALRNFKSCVYSLLITDIAMPRMDGFELYKRIKKLDAKIKVVFVTASEVKYEALRELLPADLVDISNEEEEDKAAILQGSRKEEDKDRIHFIRKPVEIKEFIQRVTKELNAEDKTYKKRRRISHETSGAQTIEGDQG
ncbi:MAG: response regulator [Candidatus Nitrosopolaris sp.]|jgi:CheY-like chemotaxis protein